MTARELEEYRELRATIRERGTARVWLFVVGLTLWSALVVAIAAGLHSPLSTLPSLLLLAGVFEAVFALHTGVERVGRYLQVFYETLPDERRWEHTVMAFGRAFPGGGSDPLFGRYIMMAAAVNLLPAALIGSTAVEWVVLLTLHVLLPIRVVSAQRQAAAQRATDRERFESLRQPAT